jgi:oligopeptide/dipeptide ABC transporter ATP-binding protein
MTEHREATERTGATPQDGEPLLRVEDLTKHFAIRGAGGWRQRRRVVRAVDGVSLQIGAGRTLGLVGESGCGKSTLGRTVLRLHTPTRGAVFLDGENIMQLGRRALLARRRDMQIVFQDPYGSLDPRRTIAESIQEPLDVHRVGDRHSRGTRVAELLDTVGLSAAMGDRYPHEFSGGQRQRVGIARALALSPRLVVADEPVSALDVSVQSQILNLLVRLQREQGLSFLFISHDLAVIQHVSHDVAVMYLGRIMEYAPVDALFGNPAHPYTRALMSAVPQPEPATGRRRIVLSGEMPSAASPPPGCPFNTRCPEAMPVCREHTPPMIELGQPGSGHRVSCHLHVPGGGHGAMAGSPD